MSCNPDPGFVAGLTRQEREVGGVVRPGTPQPGNEEEKRDGGGKTAALAQKTERLQKGIDGTLQEGKTKEYIKQRKVGNR